MSDEDVRSDFRAAFAGPQAWRDADGERIATRVERLGEIAFHSGTIAVGDPLTGMSQLTWGDKEVGRFLVPPAPIPRTPRPVEACVATYPNGDQRVSCVRVRFADAEAVRWEHTGGGAGVDSGTAGFCDGADLAAFEGADTFGESLLERVLAWGEASAPTWFGAATVHEGVGLVAVSSGWGDGLYGALWGWSAAGELVEIVLDFDLLVTDDVEWLTVERPTWGSIRHPRLAEARAKVWVPFWRRSSLVVRTGDVRVYARWRLPDGTIERMQAQSHLNDWAFDLSARPAGAELVLAVVRGMVAMKPEAR